MSKTKVAQPGDTIRITEGTTRGMKYIVVECPKKHTDIDTPSTVWVDNGHGGALWVNHERYEIIRYSDGRIPVSLPIVIIILIICALLIYSTF